jgi:hypothetical protein
MTFAVPDVRMTSTLSRLNSVEILCEALDAALRPTIAGGRADSLSNVDGHSTLLRGRAHAMEGGYHALTKERTVLLHCKSLEPPMSQMGHFRLSRPPAARPLHCRLLAIAAVLSTMTLHGRAIPILPPFRLIDDYHTVTIEPPAGTCRAPGHCNWRRRAVGGQQFHRQLHIGSAPRS